MFLWTGHFDHEKGESAEEHCIQHETKLTPLPTDKFKAVPSLNRELSDAVSFKYIKRNGWYITCKNRLCHIEPKRRTMTFERQSSFFPLLNFWYDGYTVFESTTKAGFYLRTRQRRLVIEQYDGTEQFKQEASFKTHNTIAGFQQRKCLDLELVTQNSPDIYINNNNINNINNNNNNSVDNLSSTSSPLLCPCCHSINHLTPEEDGGSFMLNGNSLDSVASSSFINNGGDVVGKMDNVGIFFANRRR